MKDRTATLHLHCTSPSGSCSQNVEKIIQISSSISIFICETIVFAWNNDQTAYELALKVSRLWWFVLMAISITRRELCQHCRLHNQLWHFDIFQQLDTGQFLDFHNIMKDRNRIRIVPALLSTLDLYKIMMYINNI